MRCAAARRSRGFTLVEMLVSSVVMLLVMNALYDLFTVGGRMLMVGQTRANLQAAALVGVNGVASDLRESALALVTVTGPGTTPTLSLRMQDPNSGLVSSFAPLPYFVIYYHDTVNRTLMRKIWGNVSGDPVTFSPSPLLLNTRLSAAQLAQIIATPNGTERAVASMVDQFAVTPSPYPVLAPTAQLTISLSLSTQLQSASYVESAMTAVAPRNKI
jgi:prepilin-type N-terminal cleavage/methylation domain-containing protein